MTVYKGEFHCILTRNFIQAIHTNSLALEFWSYLNGTFIPDEQFYPSLVRLPELPGGKARVVPSYTYDKLLSHYKIWYDPDHLKCQSAEYHYTVCQFNYKDLANIEESGRLFANKFNQNLDLVGIDCWEQWLQIKQNHHRDIDPRNYVDKYPFTRRIKHE
jgi:beta-1,6-N-acetylglucosaminyltransferase 4